MKIIRKYWLLLVGLGFSNLGNWIYLVALNLFVWHLTESPAAMAGIFVVGPTARVLTNLVAGSFIDRMNKRRLMIITDILRGLIVFLYAIYGLYLAHLYISIFNKYCE